MASDRWERIRRSARRARHLLLPGLSRSRSIRLILRSGFYDREWIAAQLRTTFATDAAAVAAYVRAEDHCSPHPLFFAGYLDRHVAPPPPGIDALTWYLITPGLRRSHSPHPLLNVHILAQMRPESVTSRFGPAAAWANGARHDDPVPTPRELPPSTWGRVRAASLAALKRWQDAQETGPQVAAFCRADGAPSADTTLVLAATGSVRAINRVIAGPLGDDDSLQLILASAALPAWKHVAVEAVADLCGGVTSVALGRSATVSQAVSAAVGHARGAVMVVSGLREELTPADVKALAHTLSDSGAMIVQPCLISGSDGLVTSGGAVFTETDRMPRPFLAGHSISDLPATTFTVPALLSDIAAMRTVDFRRLGPLAPGLPLTYALSDLSLRVAAENGRAVVATALHLIGSLPGKAGRASASRHFDATWTSVPDGSAALWAAVGLAPLQVEHPYHRMSVRRVAPALVAESAPRLRWTIDLASPPGDAGAWWGDTHFGNALARSLRRLGQHVAVDNRCARGRPTRALDDVVLVLRGLDQPVPQEGTLNLEWIISHPDLVTASEIASFDRVYAASNAWPLQVRDRWGLEVHPLLQATDPALFHVEPSEFNTGPELLFVGNSRGVFRTSVRYALECGADLTVYGGGWEKLLGDQHAHVIADQLVANAELGALYRSAGLVLNDHWDDMRREGFVSNRLVDAAAAGALVASDSVADADLIELFGGLVQPFETRDELAHLIAERDRLFPNGEDRVKAAQRVARQHSFDARAEQLLDDAVRLLREQSRQPGSSETMSTKAPA